MDVLELPLQEGALSWSHANATLIVSYAKPAEVLQAVSRDGVPSGCGLVDPYLCVLLTSAGGSGGRGKPEAES